MKDSRQLFVFVLNGEEYAVDVNNVKEIIRAKDKEVISVPNVPDFIEGITNVRGQAIPLIDLEKKFDLKQVKNDYIVIIELSNATAGLLVDNVEEVKKINQSKIKDAPEIIDQEIHRKYVDSVAVLEDRMLIILDLEVGMEDSEALEMKEISEEMSDDDQEEEQSEEVTQDEVKKKAQDRVAEKEESDSDESEESFKCEECGDEFDSKRGLASHKAQKH